LRRLNGRRRHFLENAMSYDPSKDPFHDTSSSPDSPAVDCVAVTPSDTADIEPYPKALRVYVPADIEDGVAAVKVTPKRGSDASPVTLRFPPGAHQVPLGVRRVWETGTSAGVEIHAYTV
jgi:hypothetical protein